MDKEKMFEEVMKNISSSLKEESPLLEGNISQGFLGYLTGVDIENIDENEIVFNDEHFNKNYGHIASMYGFETFYDLYLFAKSNDEVEMVEKAGQKDFSRLKKVKRTVTRNGRPTVMTFYEDPSKDSEGGGDDMDGGGEGEEGPQTPQVQSAGEIPAQVVGDFQRPVRIRDLKLIRKLHDQLGSGSEFYGDADQYSIMTDSDGFVRGIIGLEREGEYLVLAYQAVDQFTSAMHVRAFYTLVRAALKEELGAKISPDAEDKMLNSLAEDSGMVNDGTSWKATFKELNELFGELP